MKNNKPLSELMTTLYDIAYNGMKKNLTDEQLNKLKPVEDALASLTEAVKGCGELNEGEQMRVDKAKTMISAIVISVVSGIGRGVFSKVEG